jgi:hypothetical protein
MSASTRNPMIDRMLTENGAWVISDERAPDQYVIAVSNEGVIRALSIDQALSAEGFFTTAIIQKLDLSGEEKKVADWACEALAAIAIALSDEDAPQEKLSELAKRQALIDLATKTRLANDIAKVMIDNLRTALNFYADEKHYSTDWRDTGTQCEPEPPKVVVDRGAIARKAINFES